MGELIEHARTEDLCLNPAHPKTAEYIEARYGQGRNLAGFGPDTSV